MEKIQEIFEVWRAQGVRLTKTRTAFAELFSRSVVPLSVPDILYELRGMEKTVNKTTVYRELERMEQLGIIERVQLGGRKHYYELASREHHHHLVCLRCERVEDVDVDEKEVRAEERKVSREKNFSLVRHSLEFFGVCTTCQVG